MLRRLYLKVMKSLKWLPSPLYVGYYYEYYTGLRYNDRAPKGFTEKVQWYKAHYRPRILTQLVDKYAVRDFVRRRIGDQYLNRCLAVYDRVSDIDWDALPNQFVIKGVHGCGFNLIVPDKSKLNRTQARLKLTKWMHQNQYYRGGQEWAYKDVKPRLIVEEYMQEPGQAVLPDYKFFCFGGKAHFVEVHHDRGRKEYLSGFFGLDMQKMPFRDVPAAKDMHVAPPRPDNMDEMIQCAEALAKGFPFVRVDFYSVQGRTVFGEMTFYPGDGRFVYRPYEYELSIGDLFELPPLPPNSTIITTYDDHE